MTIAGKTSSLHVALFEPDIPFNTGAVARSCLAVGSALHLVGRLGFHLDDRRTKRAGLDYFAQVSLFRHDTLNACIEMAAADQVFGFSAHARRTYTAARFPARTLLVFGSETRGLPASWLADEARCFSIPIFDPRVRSLNLATAVGIVLYEVVRQHIEAGWLPPRLPPQASKVGEGA